jgi:peptide/nickel transport system substrate-binding protein
MQDGAMIAEARTPRRGRRRGALLGGAVLVASLLAASCGGDDSGGAADAPTTTGAGGGAGTTVASAPTSAGLPADADPNGVLKVAFPDVGGAIFSLDPAASNNIGDTPLEQLIYGSLLRQTGPSSFEPWFAQSVSTPDAQTVVVKIRDGIKFSDGEPYNAAAVKQSVERNQAGTGPGTGVATFNQTILQVQSVDVTGPLELTFRLKVPVAGAFYELLAGRETMAMSPKAIASGANLKEHPVGAGPYVLTQLAPQNIASFRKSPTYIEPNKWPLGGIDLVNATAGAASLNALRAGNVDIATVAPTDGDQLAKDPNFTVTEIKPDFQFNFFSFCTDRPPFNDIKVRQAIMHAIDRDAIVLSLAGHAEPAYGLWRSDSPNFNPALKQEARFDPALAKQLVSEAGAEGLQFDIGVTPNQAAMGEILIAQLSDVGLKPKVFITNSSVDDYYVNLKFLTASYTAVRPGIQRYLRPLSKESIANPCHGDYSDVMSIVAQIQALPPDDPKVPGLYQAADLAIAKGAYIIPFVFLNTAQGMSKRVGGEATYIGNNLQYDSVYVKK